jgi:hypothetical protein
MTTPGRPAKASSRGLRRSSGPAGARPETAASCAKAGSRPASSSKHRLGVTVPPSRGADRRLGVTVRPCRGADHRLRVTVPPCRGGDHRLVVTVPPCRGGDHRPGVTVRPGCFHLSSAKSDGSTVGSRRNLPKVDGLTVAIGVRFPEK